MKFLRLRAQVSPKNHPKMTFDAGCNLHLFKNKRRKFQEKLTLFWISFSSFKLEFSSTAADTNISRSKISATFCHRIKRILSKSHCSKFYFFLLIFNIYQNGLKKWARKKRCRNRWNEGGRQKNYFAVQKTVFTKLFDQGLFLNTGINAFTGPF